MHNYEIIPSKGIIVQILKGNVTKAELIELFVKTREDVLYSDQLSLVMDFRSAGINLSLDEVDESAVYYRKNCTLKGKRVILVNRSVETAKIILFRDQLNPKMTFSVFSTIDAASGFIGIPLNDFLEEEIAVREDVYM